MIYKRFPIPESERGKKDALGTTEEDKILSVIWDFVQPLPEWRYREVGSYELDRVMEVLEEMRGTSK